MKNFFNSHSGSALTIALMAALALAGMALVLMNQSKISKNISTKMVADSDVDVAVLKISSTLLQPKNCNANFYGLNVASGTLLTIQSCLEGTGSCRPTGTKTLEVTVMNAAKVAATTEENQWNPAPLYTGLTRKVRLTSATYVLDQNQTRGLATAKPAVLRLMLVFEKNLGTRSSGSGATKIQTSKVTKEIYIPVVRATFTPPNTYVESGTILGCPISPTSTVIQ